MKKNVPKSSMDLADSVARFLASFEADKVPSDWRTVTQLGRTLGCHGRTAERIIGRMARIGQVEKRLFRIHLANHIRPVPHYKFSRDAAKALGLTKRKP
jgi:hypothetical protein